MYFIKRPISRLNDKEKNGIVEKRYENYKNSITLENYKQDSNPRDEFLEFNFEDKTFIIKLREILRDQSYLESLGIRLPNDVKEGFVKKLIRDYEIEDTILLRLLETRFENENEVFECLKMKFIDEFLIKDKKYNLIDFYKNKVLQGLFYTAAEMLFKVLIEKNKKVLVVVDGDIDGVAGLVVVEKILDKLNLEDKVVKLFSKKINGGGNNSTIRDTIIKKLKTDKNIGLVLTVDFSLYNLEDNFINALKESKTSLLVTDHHFLPNETFENTIKTLDENKIDYLYLNPVMVKSSNYIDENFATLSGTGIIFFVMLNFIYVYYKNMYGNDVVPEFMVKLIKGLTPYIFLTIFSDNMKLNKCLNRSILDYSLIRIYNPKVGNEFKFLEWLVNENLKERTFNDYLLRYEIMPVLNSEIKTKGDCEMLYRLFKSEDYDEIKKIFSELADIRKDNKKIINSLLESVKTIEYENIVLILFRDNIPDYNNAYSAVITTLFSKVKPISFSMFKSDRNSYIYLTCRVDTDIASKVNLISIISDLSREKNYEVKLGGHREAFSFKIKNKDVTLNDVKDFIKQLDERISEFLPNKNKINNSQVKTVSVKKVRKNRKRLKNKKTEDENIVEKQLSDSLPREMTKEVGIDKFIFSINELRRVFYSVLNSRPYGVGFEEPVFFMIGVVEQVIIKEANKKTLNLTFILNFVNRKGEIVKYPGSFTVLRDTEEMEDFKKWLSDTFNNPRPSLVIFTPDLYTFIEKGGIKFNIKKIIPLDKKYYTVK